MEFLYRTPAMHILVRSWDPSSFGQELLYGSIMIFDGKNEEEGSPWRMNIIRQVQSQANERFPAELRAANPVGLKASSLHVLDRIR